MEHLLSRASAGCAKQTIVVICSDIETGAKLSEAIGTVEELSTSHDGWTTTGQEERERAKKKRSKQCATRNRANTGWSHLAIARKSPCQDAMTNLESDGTHISQDLAVLVHESGERMGLCGRESVGRPEELRGNHTLLEVNVFSLFQPESVNEGHPDHLSETIACWSFRVSLTKSCIKRCHLPERKSVAIHTRCRQ